MIRNSGFTDLRMSHAHGMANDDSVWPSFTDIMTVIVMIFLMALVIILIRNVDLVDQLRETMKSEQEVAALQKATELQRLQLENLLSSTEDELATSQTNLASTQQQLSASEGELDKTRQELASKLAILSSVEDELEAMQGQLNLTRQELDVNLSTLATTREELGTTQSPGADGADRLGPH